MTSPGIPASEFTCATVWDDSALPVGNITGLLDISLIIPLNKSKLFELHLKHRQYFILSERRLRRRLCRSKTGYVSYAFYHSGKNNVLHSLKEYIDKKAIRSISIEHIPDSFTVFNIANLLEGIQFRQLDVSVEFLSDSTVNNLIQMVRRYNVDKLALSVEKITAKCPGKVLLDLSDIVRSLHIYQHITGPVRPHFFFGLQNVDWAPVILEMFSRKLETLLIENPFYPEYLWVTSSNLLIEQLPTIGKKIWFSATCNKYENGFDKFCKDHHVQADDEEAFNCALRVIHWSKANEFPDHKVSLRRETKIREISGSY